MSREYAGRMNSPLLNPRIRHFGASSGDLPQWTSLLVSWSKSDVVPTGFPFATSVYCSDLYGLKYKWQITWFTRMTTYLYPASMINNLIWCGYHRSKSRGLLKSARTLAAVQGSSTLTTQSARSPEGFGTTECCLS